MAAGQNEGSTKILSELLRHMTFLYWIPNMPWPPPQVAVQDSHGQVNQAYESHRGKAGQLWVVLGFVVLQAVSSPVGALFIKHSTIRDCTPEPQVAVQLDQGAESHKPVTPLPSTTHGKVLQSDSSGLGLGFLQFVSATRPKLL